MRLRPYPPPLFHQHHPMAIAEYALDCHRMYLETGKEEYRKAFLDNACWFARNIEVVDGKYGFWYYDFRDTLQYNVNHRFRSSMVQGYGISVLLRAYQLTGDSRFLDPTHYALSSYELEVSKGGIKSYYRDHVFYEEAPTIPPSCILNGFIFSLIGLYDFFRFESNSQAKALFDEGINTLAHCLHLYDLGYWSRYNLQYRSYLASRYYHHLHVRQLELLYRITGLELFNQQAIRWQGYSKSIASLGRYYATYYGCRFNYKLQRIKHFVRSL